MKRQPLSGSKLRSAGYDERLQHLEIEFADRSVRRYKGVPAEVWRRLLSAPTPYSYFEDRIAEEYPSEPASADAPADARARLDDLFR
ncbi:MAG: KTSC domain-containing protein [Burkholderiaceae bacterium]